MPTIPLKPEVKSQIDGLLLTSRAKHAACIEADLNQLQLYREAGEVLQTVFATVTVNLNARTAVHKDQGDLKDGFWRHERVARRTLGVASGMLGLRNRHELVRHDS